MPALSSSCALGIIFDHPIAKRSEHVQWNVFRRVPGSIKHRLMCKNAVSPVQHEGDGSRRLAQFLYKDRKGPG